MNSIHLLNKEKVSQMAKEVVKSIASIDKEKKNGLIDYAFTLSKGQMTNKKENTFFCFDLSETETPELYALMSYMSQDELSEKEENNINECIGDLSNELLNNNISEIRDCIRNQVVPSSNADSIPLQEILIKNIEIVNYNFLDEDSKYLFKVVKDPKTHIDMVEIQSYVQSIKADNPEKTIFDIANEEKEKGNPLFNGIQKIEVGEKYLWNFTLSLYVDYSFAPATSS